MSSESELSNAVPNDSDLKHALRQTVINAKREGGLHSTTVKTIRTVVENKFDLEENFFKSDSTWNQRSKDIINTTIEEIATPEPESEPESETPPPKKQSRKRAPVANGSKVNKRQRTATPEEDSTEDRQASKEQRPSEKAPTNTRRSGRSVTEDNSEDEDFNDEEQESDPQVTTKSEDDDDVEQPSKEVDVAQDSESEMSDVKDEPPPSRKKRQKESAPTKSKAKPATKSMSKSKANIKTEATPDEAEIKRLQGWLIKCGIRKLWGKELATYSTAKAKINHLKGMLKEAGMEGRYSVEKASAIKERRELAADLEAVTEGNKNWGKDSEEDDRAAAKRKVASRFVDFGDDGEDSD